jgi:hypothetical protein
VCEPLAALGPLSDKRSFSVWGRLPRNGGPGSSTQAGLGPEATGGDECRFCLAPLMMITKASRPLFGHGRRATIPEDCSSSWVETEVADFQLVERGALEGYAHFVEDIDSIFHWVWIVKSRIFGY